MNEMSDYEIIDAMVTLGGSFVKALGRCFQTADAINFQKLKDAFPEYWKQYDELAAARPPRGTPNVDQRESYSLHSELPICTCVVVNGEYRPTTEGCSVHPNAHPGGMQK